MCGVVSKILFFSHDKIAVPQRVSASRCNAMTAHPDGMIGLAFVRDGALLSTVLIALFTVGQ